MDWKKLSSGLTHDSYVESATLSVLRLSSLWRNMDNTVCPKRLKNIHCRIQEVVAPARGVMSIKFENPEIKKRCGDTLTALYCLSGRSNKGLQIENESVPRMWHLLARSGLSE